MAMFILLTSQHAAAVRGASNTNPAASLNPVERQGGIYILGAEVLADPAHAAHLGVLAGLPQLDSEDLEFPPALAPPDL